MAAGQHKLSRRALLAGACAGAALPFDRHSGLDPESISLPAADKERLIPDQVRDDGKWTRALARYAEAEGALEAVAHTEDDDLYGRRLGRHAAALARLLRAPAPDVAAAARKLELIMAHSVFEASFGEASLRTLARDLRRLA